MSIITRGYGTCSGLIVSRGFGVCRDIICRVIKSVSRNMQALQSALQKTNALSNKRGKQLQSKKETKYECVSKSGNVHTSEKI